MLRSSVVQAGIGENEDAHEHFQKAINNFERYSLPWEMADTFHLWGLALLSAGENAELQYRPVPLPRRV
jgi:hypothetical protein